MDTKRIKDRKPCFLKKISKDKWIIILEVILLVGICLLHAIDSRRYGDFNAINGTFQNFNPIRRFLDGQIPYKDFTDYLGMGHLYMGSIFTFLLGSTYQASLYAFDFLAILSLALIFFVVGNCLIKDKKTSLAVTILLVLMVIVKPYVYTNLLAGTKDVKAAVMAARSTGNSARFLRGMILPIVCLLFMVGQLIYKNVVNCVTKKLENKPNNKEKVNKITSVIGLLGVSIIAGFSFIWSNDYGISSCVCLVVMCFLVVLARTRKISKAVLSLLVMVAGIGISIFAFIEIFTLGHFPQWFKFTFNTGDFQSWYYNPPKSYYLFDVDFSFLMILQAVLCVLYLYKVFKDKGSKEVLNRYGVLAFVNMTGFCAVNEYKLLSGGKSREVALSILFATIIFELLFYFKKLNTSAYAKKIVVIVGIAVGFSWVFAEAMNESVYTLFRNKEGVYFEQLGGRLKKMDKDVMRGHDFLNGDKCFSTYASAKEVVEGTYQPTGTDYIIHVLGDESRQDYLNVFKEGKHKYTATIKEGYDEWEYWIQRANWFFYRELFSNWKPVYSTSYETYWVRNSKKENKENTINVKDCVKIVDAGEAVKKIVIDTDKDINGIADVFIDYEVDKKDTIGTLLVFRTMLSVRQTSNEFATDDQFELNMLRKKNKEYIPITVVNGHGEVTLKSMPEANTTLKVSNVSCNRIFKVMFNSLDIIDFRTTKDKDKVVLTIDKIGRNEVIIDKMDKIIIGKDKYKVSKVKKLKRSYELTINTKGKDRITYESFKDSNFVEVCY